ncbi:MAG TPA: DUF2294 domain-containing protein [Solirubrobacteraceae bacterium]|nr:DUF2294 domain-containing protein [Solirubrobacteraceae bacterium]
MDQPQTPADGERTSSERGQLMASVANAVVRTHKRFYGKGPVKARAHLSQDLLTVLLEGGLTRGEQMLNEHGHTEEVVRARSAMQETVENELRVAVESILYRKVRSFLSANDPANDMQIEAFVLEPEGSEALDGAGDVPHEDGEPRESPADAQSGEPRESPADPQS